MTNNFSVSEMGQRDRDRFFFSFGLIVSTVGVSLSLLDTFPLGLVNFYFFSTLLFLLALYRPNWCFLLLVSVLPFEIITISPPSLDPSLRPYQWIFLILVSALLIRIFSGRTRWLLFTLSPIDFFLALIPVGALISGTLSGGEGIRLAIIVTSFYTLYLLSRVFLKTVGDLRIATHVFFSSGFVTAIYGIVENIAFEQNSSISSIMPGRPNAFFTEPDWLGFFVALLLILALAKLIVILQKYQSVDGAKKSITQILLLALLLLPIVTVLILTVSRSAWIAAFAGIFTLVLTASILHGREIIRPILQSGQIFIITFGLALVIAVDIPLTRFDLWNRTESTATGLQEITVACEIPIALPETITSLDELKAFGCRHINLEERAAFQSAGLSIQTVHRPDPNVAVRGEIYTKTWAEIRAHPVFGIGWGNIGGVLGTDMQGSAYNASNVWLELFLGAGLIGFLGLLGTVIFVLYQIFGKLFRTTFDEREGGMGLPLAIALFLVFLTFNLFNAGLLIGLVWVGFAFFPPLLTAAHKTETT